jgi:hypothetical protein
MITTPERAEQLGLTADARRMRREQAGRQKRDDHGNSSSS